MATIYDLLKTDPYKDSSSDETYIDHDVFFDKVYFKFDEKIKNAKENLLTGNQPYRIVRINGYAGCGKTLFAHYLMREIGYSDDFYYEFDKGEGKEYPLTYVVDKMKVRISKEVSKIMAQSNARIVFDIFFDMGGEIIGKDVCYSCLQELFYGQKESILNALDDTDRRGARQQERISTIIDSIIAKYRADTNNTVQFLLLFDFFLRSAIAISDNNFDERKIVFCLLDNLDNLRRDAVVTLYTNLMLVIDKLINFRSDIQTSHYYLKKIKYFYIFPTRAVTYRKLRDGLRRRGKGELVNESVTVFPIELALSSSIHGKIIQKRIEYWDNTDIKDYDDAKERIQVIKSLMEMSFVQGTFSSLLNNNYSRCIDRILEMFKKKNMAALCTECAQFENVSKSGNYDFRKCAGEAARGTFLRLILEVFKDGDIYRSSTDLNEDNLFSVNSKLGLVSLGQKTHEDDIGVSLSRIFLTFIEGAEHKTESLYEIFECFSFIDSKKICRELFALSENARDIWRRLIMFNTNVPKEIEDMYKQADQFSADPTRNRGQYTEVEMCQAGSTYLTAVVPSFEFFLSRLGDLDEYPPLFSVNSIRRKNGKEKWDASIEAVLQSIERCSEEIYTIFRSFIIFC